MIVNHNLTQSPDRFFIVDARNGSAGPLTYSDNENGDWHFDNTSNNLSYLGQTHTPYTGTLHTMLV